MKRRPSVGAAEWEAAVLAWAVGDSVEAAFAWGVATLAAAGVEWQAPVSVVALSVLGVSAFEVREFIAESGREFALPDSAAAMLVVSVPDGEAFGPADGTAIAGLATDGEDGASPWLRLR